MMSAKEILVWNLLFSALYLLSSTIIYVFSGDPPETIPVIILIGILFNAILTTYLLWRRNKVENPMEFLLKFMFGKKKTGGEKKNEKTSANEVVADTKSAVDTGSASDIY